MSILLSLLIIVLCCVVIWRASDGFEIASSYLGRNLSEGVRGATINAIGSSMPELFTTFWFLFFLADRDGFAGGIGTTAGSAIFNSMIIPAVVILAVLYFGMAKKIEISRKVFLRDGISLIVAEAFLIVIISGDRLEWWHGLFLMCIYGIYLLITFKTMQKTVTDPEEVYEMEPLGTSNLVQSLITFDIAPLFLRNGLSTIRMWGLLVVTMIFIGLACFLLVYACEWLGVAMGIEYYFVAVIIASAATSVPDTIISYRDAIKGEYDDALANALGSNIFDICFALGFPLFIYTLLHGTIVMSPETVKNVSEMRVLLVLLTALAFVIYITRRSFGKREAVGLLAIYVLFTIYILGRAYDVAFFNNIGEYLQILVRS